MNTCITLRDNLLSLHSLIYGTMIESKEIKEVVETTLSGIKEGVSSARNNGVRIPIHSINVQFSIALKPGMQSTQFTVAFMPD